MAEAAVLAALPSAERYEKSYMHRDIVTHVVVAQETEFVGTASAEGHVKLWKKMRQGIEFAKHYHAHLGAVVSLCLSSDGLWLVSTGGTDGGCKMYDVAAFDMVCIVRESGFMAGIATWFAGDKLAVAQRDRVAPIHIYAAPDFELLGAVRVHESAAVVAMCPAKNDFIVSSDTRGLIEYWRPPDFSRTKRRKLDQVETSTHSAIFPSEATTFSVKVETDLYELAKLKVEARSLVAKGQFLAVPCSDAKLRIFHLATGRLLRVFDESIESIERALSSKTVANASSASSDEDGPLPEASRLKETKPIQNSVLATVLDAFNTTRLNRKKANEQEAISKGDSGWNAVFDDSGQYLIYACVLGIKIVDIRTGDCVRILGHEEESERFQKVALFQGTVDTQMEGNLDTQSVTVQKAIPDPTLFCTACKRKRFYLLTRRSPTTIEDRDIFNEKPDIQSSTSHALAHTSADLADRAILRTTMGDIWLELYPDDCPKTVENFCRLAKKGYYDGHIFHRVIANFMVQTGDPKGDGTGGESIWGSEFVDEIRPNLTHDQPFMLSMANAGPNTNGSQFFITTVPTPWLNGKHTVWGKVFKGMMIVKAIEGVQTDRFDKPIDDIKIISIALSFSSSAASSSSFEQQQQD